MTARLRFEQPDAVITRGSADASVEPEGAKYHPGMTPESPVVFASVIVPAYCAAGHLRHCLDSVLAQEVSRTFEVIVVVSGDDGDDLGYADDVPRDDRLEVTVRRPRLSAAEARNLGTERARGEFLVFTDADVVAAPGWLETLLGAATGGRCAAGAVTNGTPRSPAGTTEYLVEFLDLHPGRPVDSAWHGGTANLALPRELWTRFGPLLDAIPGEKEVGSADTSFTLRLAQAGCFSFCPDASVRHMNRTSLRKVLVHQRKLGRNTAVLARRNQTFPYRWLVSRAWAVPLVVGARWLSLWRRLLGWRIGMAGRALALTGHLVLALGAWGLGLFEMNRALERGQRTTALDPVREPLPARVASEPERYP